MTRPGRPLEAPLSPWLRPNVVGVIAITAATSATTPAAMNTARPTLQRTAASVPRPTRSAPIEDRDRVSSSATHRIASTAPVTSTVRRRRAYRTTEASRIITSARNRPKMFGSKNTELTVKYACSWLAAISFGFRKIVLVSYSTNPTRANSTASPASSARQVRVSR